MTGFLNLIEVGGDEFAALVEIFGMGTCFFEGEQHMIAFDFAEQFFADVGDGLRFVADG